MRNAFRAFVTFPGVLVKNTKGSVALFFALALVPTLLAAGGAVDFTRYYDARQTIQTALDASVLAGSAADNNDSVAQQTFSSWDVTVTGTLGTPTYSATDTSDASRYTGTVHAKLKMYFLPLIGMKTLNFTTISTAERTISSGTTSNLCLKLKDTSASPGLNVNGGTIAAPDCEIDVDSASSSAVTFDRTVTADKICVAGAVSHVNRTPDNYYTSCTPQSDPYAASGALPETDATACASTGSDVNYNNNGAAVTVEEGDHCGRLNFSGGTLTLYPGTYGGGINFNNSPTVILKPGVYIIKNSNWNLNGGSITGTGVTLYFADSAFIQFNNNAAADLSAPTSGDYSGILMYEADGLSDSSWTYNMKGTLTGVMHLPSRNVTLNSSSPVTACGLWVFNTLISSTTLNMETDGNASGTSGYSTPHLVK